MTRTRSLLFALTLCLCCACSGPTGEPSAPAVVRPTAVTDEHNDTDLAYVDRLGSQQQQAVDLVAMVSNRDVSPEVRELAAQIDADRSDEVRALRRMARAWGVPPHPPEFHGNPGELTLEQLSALYGQDGPGFEARWLQRMTDNHRGAVAMSKAELDDGLNLGTREFARGLIELQESQIEQLETLQE